jgi:hypothetical protein
VSLLKYVIVAAAGYYAGQPSGRRQVEQLRQQAADLVRSPKAAELKQRGRELAGERASAVVGKVRRKSSGDSAVNGVTAGSDTPTAGSDTPTVGSATETTTRFEGHGVADDTQAIRTGVLSPGPAPRTADGT